jgi:hypothetical protein
MSEADDLRARIAALEGQTRQAFDDAQRQADALFSQYQLSQILASGGGPSDLAYAVIVELVRIAGASAAAIWLGDSGSSELVRLAVTGLIPDAPPGAFDDLEAARGGGAEGGGPGGPRRGQPGGGHGPLVGGRPARR